MFASWPRTLLNTLLILAVTFAAQTSAQAQTGVTMTVEAGFDRYCKEGKWIPVRVLLENNGPDIEGQVEARPRSAVGNDIVYSAPVTLPTNSRKEVMLYIYPDGYLSDLPVRLVSGRNILADENVRLNCLSAADIVFAILAGSASGFSALTKLDPANGTAAIAELDTGDIPDRSQALDALDVLILSDIDAGNIKPAQRKALGEWVAMGGRLWIAGGSSWQKTSAGLDELLPLIPNGARTLDDLSALQQFSRVEVPLEGNAVAATGVVVAGAEILLTSHSGLPLIVRKRIGEGETVFLAVDPGLAPLKNWDGSLELYRRLFSDRRERPGWANGFQDWRLAAQAAAALPSMNLPSGFLICGLLGVYILAIGPLNYLLLRKVKRRELAWVSIPLLVMMFSGATFLFGNRLRGSLPILNRLAIVQWESGSPLARVSGLLGIYSPHRRGYQVRFSQEFLAHPIPFQEEARQWLFSQQNAGMSIPDLRVDIGGIVPLTMEGSIPPPEITHDIKLVVEQTPMSVVRLQGSLTNNSPLILNDVVLLTPGSAKPLGELQPGETIPVDFSLSQAQRAGPVGSLTNLPMGALPNPALPSYTLDNTISDILGVTNYWDNKNNFRRYAMLASALNANSIGVSRGWGIYLSGWTSTSPLEISLGSNNGAFSTEAVNTSDTTLYLATLTPAFESDETRQVFPPGLFTWKLIEANPYSEVSPYNLYLTSGSYAFQFELAQPFSYSRVESLTLHLKSSVAEAPNGFNLFLWNWEAGTWEPVPELHWGDIELQEPARYVGARGAIRLRIENSDPGQSTQIDSSDFTLVVRR